MALVHDSQQLSDPDTTRLLADVAARLPWEARRWLADEDGDQRRLPRRWVADASAISDELAELAESVETTPGLASAVTADDLLVRALLARVELELAIDDAPLGLRNWMSVVARPTASYLGEAAKAIRRYQERSDAPMR